jgi:hypothetical protein
MMEKAHLHFTLLYWNRFSLLLISIILAFALSPFLESFIRIKMLTDIVLSAILISAIHAISEKKSTLLMGLVLVLPCIVLKWSNYLLESPLFGNWAEVFGAFFTAYILISIWAFISRQQEVTSEVIMAAICGYFLIGFMWGFIYFFLNSARPGSFQMASSSAGEQSSFIYFSFVTMTTVGYGDTTPLSNAARSLSILEAVMGQLYLAVTIARLLGAYVSRKSEKQAG